MWIHRALHCSAALLAAALLVAPAAAQDDRVTVQLRNGEKVTGQLEDLDKGVLFVRVSLHDQRKLPIADVALIDLVGGATGLPPSEISEAKAGHHLLLTESGTSMKGTLVDVAGGPGSQDEKAPRVFVFRQADGMEKRVAAADVGRIYLGNYPFGATSGDVTNEEVPPGAIRVAAAADWVSTGMIVKAGERIGFSTTGEVKLSANADDTAKSPGNERRAAGAPLPMTAAGALIGRIGANGTPFGIGNQTMVPMPEAGMLFLSVNDDERGDNSGAFVVTVTRPTSR